MAAGHDPTRDPGYGTLITFAGAAAPPSTSVTPNLPYDTAADPCDRCGHPQDAHSGIERYEIRKYAPGMPHVAVVRCPAAGLEPVCDASPAWAERIVRALRAAGAATDLAAELAAAREQAAWATAHLGKVWAALTGGDEGQTIAPEDVLAAAVRVRAAGAATTEPKANGWVPRDVDGEIIEPPEYEDDDVDEERNADLEDAEYLEGVALLLRKAGYGHWKADSVCEIAHRLRQRSGLAGAAGAATTAPIDDEAFYRFQAGGLDVVGDNVRRHQPRQRVSAGAATPTPEPTAQELRRLPGVDDAENALIAAQNRYARGEADIWDVLTSRDRLIETVARAVLRGAAPRPPSAPSDGVAGVTEEELAIVARHLDAAGQSNLASVVYRAAAALRGSRPPEPARTAALWDEVLRTMRDLCDRGHLSHEGHATLWFPLERLRAHLDDSAPVVRGAAAPAPTPEGTDA
ncbi:MAG TPA: hypothetical protein VFQ38_09065 [Longimicrobiales bacterium]|nr:hypothetical protein [Longimicrobiales bacterium]